MADALALISTSDPGIHQSLNLWPEGSREEEMEAFCRTCPKRYFKAMESGCLICGRGRLEPAALSQIKFTAGTEYLYECPVCGTQYFAYEDLE
jgi:hypothetical protein